jgi:hypothetical protein
MTVPFVRYLAFVGAALIGLLFVADWVWPTVPSAPSLPAQQSSQVSTESPVEQSIRIRSARRWPDKIDFDTTQPTVVPPPPAPMVAEAPPAPSAAAPVVADNSPLDARAEVKPLAKPATPAPKRHASRTRHHNNYGQSDYWGRPPTYAYAGPSWSFGRW